MDIFVARQPIFNHRKQLFGYELLFRQDMNGASAALPTGDSATSIVLTNAFFLIGMETLTSGRRGFVNFTRNLLLSDMPSAFPRGLMAVEILEDIQPDVHVLYACRRLKQAGYLLVLDDFTYDPIFDPLIEIVDIIKVDFLSTPVEERAQMVRRLRRKQLRFLAEKVETQADFEMAMAFGYSYVQGFFFSKPDIVIGRDIPGYKLNYLNTIREINQRQINIEKLEQIIQRDTSLSYKLLRLINSAFFGLQHRIKSIRHALVLLGYDELRKWASLLILSGLGDDKPHELAMLSAVRARFCELLAEKIGMQSERTEIYLMGLFSLVDAFLDQPMEQILQDLPITESSKNALLGNPGPYTPVVQLVLAYEAANWVRVDELAAQLGQPASSIPSLYHQALGSANNVLGL